MSARFVAQPSAYFPPVLRIRLLFEAQDLVAPPAAIGAMWRGVFGAALRRNNPTAYTRLFQPAATGSGTVAGGSMPAPFVLDVDHHSEIVLIPGDRLAVDVTLLGDACSDAPVVVEAFAEAGTMGLGKTRGHAALIEAGTVWSDTHEACPMVPAVPPKPKRAAVVLRSPWATGSAHGPTTQRAFQASLFLGAMQRRIDTLAAVHLGVAMPTRPSPEVEISDVQLWTTSLSRWSSKLSVEDDMSGTMGSFIAHLPENDALWQALWWSQWAHVGRKTSFGLGSLRIHPLA